MGVEQESTTNDLSCPSTVYGVNHHGKNALFLHIRPVLTILLYVSGLMTVLYSAILIVSRPFCVMHFLLP